MIDWRRYKSEYAALVKLGTPVLVTQLCVITINFADTLMVGAYGLNELAASAFVNSLYMVTLVMLMGFAGGVTPLIGALYSKGDDYGIGHTLRTSIRVNVWLSGAFTLIMGILWFFLDRMGQPPELMPLIKQYYLILLGSVIPLAIFNCCQQMANGTTDTSSPMWVMIVTNTMNVAGNYCLIFGRFGFPEMGLAGAGVSTLAARITGAVAMFCIVAFTRRYRHYRDGLMCAEPGGDRIRRVWTTSYPIMLQSGVECLLWAFGAVVAGWFGTVQLGAYQVVNTIGQLGFMIYMSIGVAVSIRVANHMGVRDYGGIRDTTVAGLHITTLMATGASLLFLVAAPALIGFFNDTPEVIRSGEALVLPLILYQYCDSVQLTYASAQRGTSEARPLMWTALISYIAVGVPVLLWFAIGFDLGNVGVYYSFSVALLSAALLLRMWFLRTLKRLEESEAQPF